MKNSIFALSTKHDRMPAQQDDRPKILIIDDNHFNLEFLSAMLRRVGYQTSIALDGERGLQTVENFRPDLILLDIVMPGIDGIEVCRKLKQDDKWHSLPVIFLSSKASPSLIVRAFHAGGIDYVKKPFVKEEVLARVAAHLKIGMLTRELKQKNTELERQQGYIREDLDAAGQIQRSLLPSAKARYKTIHADWFFRPTEQVGGDIFNLLPFDERYMLIYMVDVSGHGMSSALIATLVSQALLPHSGVLTGNENKQDMLAPGLVLDELDKMFPFERFDKFFTMFLAYYDEKKQTLTYSHAAHPFGYILHNGGKISQLGQGGTVIGIKAGLPFPELSVPWHTGDKLVLFTDGITEMSNPNGEMFGWERLFDFFSGHYHLSCSELKQALETELGRFAGNAPPQDDISFLCIEVK